jgi:hypothetical protein
MSTRSVVYRESRHMDGITYELRVFAVDGGLYGTFWCPRCDVTEINSVLSARQADAIRATVSHIDSHHAERHPPKT